MYKKQYTYRTRLTPRGRHIVEVLDGEEVLATSKHAHPSAEAALREVQTALENLSLREVTHSAALLLQPNGKRIAEQFVELLQ